MKTLKKFDYGRGKNGSGIQLGDLSVYFSYSTVVAFWTPRTGLKIRENDWGATTGRHLSAIESMHGADREDRVKGSEFDELLNQIQLTYEVNL
jgi:hypothetical protein